MPGGAMPVSPIAYAAGVVAFTQAEEQGLWAQVAQFVQNGARGGGGPYLLGGVQYQVQWTTNANSDGIIVTGHQP